MSFKLNNVNIYIKAVCLYQLKALKVFFLIIVI